MALKELKILVTGGAGFIGSHLTAALLKQGHVVRVLDNFATGKRENLAFDKTYRSFEMMEGDICDLSSCRQAMAGIQYVFHQAAVPSVQRSVEDPLNTHSANANGTLNILLSARDACVKRVMYASSSSIYGDTPTLPKHEDMPPNPLSPYALQKYVGEQYCRLFSQLYGLETISLRYFNIFGPRQDPSSVYSAVIPKFIEALLQKNSPLVFGDGEQSRDFTYVGNVVHANLLAMSADCLQGEVVNVACGQRTSLNQLIANLKRITGSNASPVHKEPRKGDVRHSLADITRAKKVIGYDPEVDLEKGLKETVDFFRKPTG